MKATRINHVSVRALDLEASVAFYTELFGATPIATPNFGGRLAWLQLGESQIHIFERGEGWDRDAHFAVEVDDFEAIYRAAESMAVFDTKGNWGHHIFSLLERTAARMIGASSGTGSPRPPSTMSSAIPK